VYLAEKVKLLKSTGYKRILVVGHTDSTGSYAHNMELSRRRAKSVRDYLVSQGISANKIQTKGVGSTDPAIPKPKNKSEQAENRRVEILAWE
jgi:outer membrane protein OmpA-like peptidoglycan-associated protein